MKVTPKLKRNSIVLSFKLNTIQYEVYTGETISPEKWNHSKKIIKGEGHLINERNTRIKKLQSEIELYIFSLKRDGKEYFHQELKDHLKKLDDVNSTEHSNSDFLSFFEKYIEEGELKYAIQTLRAYRTSKRHITDFILTKGKKSVSFESFTSLFFKQFNEYLKTNAMLSPSSRGKQIKNIKAVMGEALKSGLHSNRDFQDVKKDNEPSINVYLNIDEITKLNGYKNYNPIERKLVDAFLFICYTGLRFTDYHRIKKHNFSHNIEGERKVYFMKFIQNKTNEELMVPLMYGQAVKILEKYDFDLPKFTNAYLNREIKEILAKYNLLNDKIEIRKEKINGTYIKRELITVHTGRRSFCTNQYIKGTPSQFIMAASGHKTESAFRLYIKADQLDRAKGLLNFIDY